MIGQRKTGEKGSARVMSNKFFAKMDKQNRSAKERRRALVMREAGNLPETVSVWTLTKGLQALNYLPVVR